MEKSVKQNTATPVDADYSLEAVPDSARKGFWQMFFVMLGFTFFSASMSVGAKLGNGLDLSGFVWACLIGGIILSAYCGVLAFIGSKTGLNMDLLCRRTFGSKGSYLSSAILGFTQIGWFGVGVAMFSIPAAELMGMNEWTLTIIAGLLMTATRSYRHEGTGNCQLYFRSAYYYSGRLFHGYCCRRRRPGWLTFLRSLPGRLPCLPVSAMLLVLLFPVVLQRLTLSVLPKTAALPCGLRLLPSF